MGFFTGLIHLLLTAIATQGAEVIVHDTDGVLGATHSPVMAVVTMSRNERRFALEGKMQVCEVTAPNSRTKITAPIQVFTTSETNGSFTICWFMPPGAKGKRSFRLEKTRERNPAEVVAKRNLTNGQFDLTDGGKPVLRYNYAIVEPGDIIEQVKPANRIYARARSDYIHPLFGLEGETLTKDFSADHPHHRGIYWAWPEVDWRGNRGDLHALQHVIARPTGKCTTISGPVFAQIEAENVWKWEDTNAVVHERAVIRAYQTPADERIIDLEFEFTALNDPVLLARRNTDKYGGLNLRFAAVTNQEIATHTDTNTAPRTDWAELSGKFGDAPQTSGVVVLQHNSNPDYPGDWVQFPNLNWLQPTFPASGTRYELKKGEPLVLRFRLWLHRGGKSEPEKCAVQWRAYHASSSPKYFPVSANPKRPSSS